MEPLPEPGATRPDVSLAAAAYKLSDGRAFSPEGAEKLIQRAAARADVPLDGLAQALIEVLDRRATGQVPQNVR